MQEWATIAVRVLKNRGDATIQYDSFEHVQNSRGLSRSMPISGDRLRFVPNHGDAFTNALRMHYGSPRFLKSWTIGTKDRDSVTEALAAPLNDFCCFISRDLN